MSQATLAAPQPLTPMLPARESLVDTEAEFYARYGWSLNPFPTVEETVAHLRADLDFVRTNRGPDWQRREALTNVFLLGCALLNAVDDYVRGKSLRLPGRLASFAVVRLVQWTLDRLVAAIRWRRRSRARKWRNRWQPLFSETLSHLVDGTRPEPESLAQLADRLVSRLPKDLAGTCIYFPSAFRRLDLTHLDILELGDRFVARYPDRNLPILLLGLRTAGSYFAPLLQAYLRAQGYRSVASVTVHTQRGPGAAERAQLRSAMRAGCTAVVLDDPPHTGSTIVQAVTMLCRVGFAANKVVVLVPTHPAGRDWRRSFDGTGTAVVSLEPEKWHKQSLLAPEAIAAHLAEIYGVARDQCEVLNRSADAATFVSPGGPTRTARLKRVYEVRLRLPGEASHTELVIAKSVGWGWLSYHAFLAGRRLAGHVPKVLSLRDGILYSQWISPSSSLDLDAGETSDEQGPTTTAVASYIGARVRSLRLETANVPEIGMHRHHDGFRLLEKVLSRAHGRLVTSTLMRTRLREELSRMPCPYPTLIDGKMGLTEWIRGSSMSSAWLKTDYEHHGLGKNEANSIDPAFDLADAVLQLELSAEDEDVLIRQYVRETGDDGVAQRLMLYKLLAGHWAIVSGDPQRGFHERFLRSLQFLTVQMARYCGSYCRGSAEPGWHPRLAVLDIDGVIDRWIFGFPSTTAAGIQAIALLHAHGFGIAVNTARSVREVKEYCRAYGFAGGVAEYGAYIWDAVNQRGKVLLATETRRQIERARLALEKLPGAFIDDRYEHSIRAFTYEDKGSLLGRLPLPGPLRTLLKSGGDELGTVPLPTFAVRELMADPGLDRLTFKQTTMDTTIIAKETDKGTGLSSLLDWTRQAHAETIAVGDSEPDLAMFRVARRSFAPAHIGCASLARLLGCRINGKPYQRGLLNIVRSLVHPQGGRCAECASSTRRILKGRDLLPGLLRAADGSRPMALLRALMDPKSYAIFVR